MPDWQHSYISDCECLQPTSQRLAVIYHMTRTQLPHPISILLG
jgi:hypothetical protein